MALTLIAILIVIILATIFVAVIIPKFEREYPADSLDQFRATSRKSKNAEKSFFFDGGDDFTDEDYIFMEMMEDDDEFF